MNTKISAVIYSVLFSGLGIFSYLLLILNTNISFNFANEVVFSVGAALFFILAFNILGHSTIRLSSWINDQYPLYITKRWRIAVIYGTVTLMLLLINYGLLVLAKFLVGSEAVFTFQKGGLRILIIVWLVELVILGLLVANNSIQNTLKLQKQAALLQEENDKALYVALQNQLNPHFLFNSLNTLIAEIDYDPKNAIVFTKDLSNVYRYVLQFQNKPLVSLDEELEFARAYLFLHKVRLGDCIKWNSDIPSDYMESMLPPLTLQLLVENVIKHNTITSNKPMEIRVTIENGSLVVSNSIHLKKNMESSGVGLNNLSNRCKLILGRDIDVTDNDGVFTVKIPLLYE